MPHGNKKAKPYWPAAINTGLTNVCAILRRQSQGQEKVCYLHWEDFLSKSIQTFHFVDVQKFSFRWQDPTKIKKHQRRKWLGANKVSGRPFPLDSKIPEPWFSSGKSHYHPTVRAPHMTKQVVNIFPSSLLLAGE